MWNSPSKEYTLMPDGRRVCVASEWKLRSNPSSAAASMTGSPKPSSMASPKPSSTSSPKMYSPPMPSPMQAPNRAPLPPSLEEATSKLEAGQRNALEEELEEWAAAAEEKEEEEKEEAAAAAEGKLEAAATATPQKVLEAAPQEPVEVCQASKVVDLQAWQAKELEFRRMLVRDYKYGGVLVAVGGGVLVTIVGDALLAALLLAVLQAWYSKGLAMHEAWQIKGLSEKRALADKEFGGALLRAGGAVLLAVFLLWLLGVSSSGEQPAPGPVTPEYTPNNNNNNYIPHHHLLGSEFCFWRWKAFRCSTGCKPRMHWPVLQGACTPM